MNENSGITYGGSVVSLDKIKFGTQSSPKLSQSNQTNCLNYDKEVKEIEKINLDDIFTCVENNVDSIVKAIDNLSETITNQQVNNTLNQQDVGACISMIIALEMILRQGDVDCDENNINETIKELKRLIEETTGMPYETYLSQYMFSNMATCNDNEYWEPNWIEPIGKYLEVFGNSPALYSFGFSYNNYSTMNMTLEDIPSIREEIKKQKEKLEIEKKTILEDTQSIEENQKESELAKLSNEIKYYETCLDQLMLIEIAKGKPYEGRAIYNYEEIKLDVSYQDFVNEYKDPKTGGLSYEKVEKYFYKYFKKNEDGLYILKEDLSSANIFLINYYLKANEKIDSPFKKNLGPDTATKLGNASINGYNWIKEDDLDLMIRSNSEYSELYLNFATQEEILMAAFLSEKMKSPDSPYYYYKTEESTYIKILRDVWKNRAGMYDALMCIDEYDGSIYEGELTENVENYLTAFEQGFEDGFYNFGEGIWNLGMTLLSGEGTTTRQDYKEMYLASILAQQSDYISWMYNNGQTVGYITPTVIISAIANFIAPGSGETLAQWLMFTSSMGNNMDASLLEGHSYEIAFLYSALSSGSEVLMEKAFGGIWGLSDNKKSFLISLISEGGEEAAQTVFEYLIRNRIYGDSIDIENMAYDSWNAFIMGAAVAGELNGFSATLDVVISGKLYTINNVNELVDLYKTGGMNAIKSKYFELDPETNKIISPKKDQNIIQEAEMNQQSEIFAQANEALTNNDTEGLLNAFANMSLENRIEFIRTLNNSSHAIYIYDNLLTSKEQVIFIENITKGYSENGINMSELLSFDQKLQVEVLKAIDAKVLLSLPVTEQVKLVSTIRTFNLRHPAASSTAVKILEAEMAIKAKHAGEVINGVPVENMSLSDMRKIDYLNNEIIEFTEQQYREIVISDKVEWETQKELNKQATKNAKNVYEFKHGPGSFDSLPQSMKDQLITEQKGKIDIEATRMAKRAAALATAQATIDKIKELKSSGKIKEQYTADDVLRMIQDNVSPETYLTDVAVKEWKSKWGTPDQDGNVKVYIFQDAKNGALSYGGSVGRAEGAFVLTSDFYNQIMSNQVIGKDGNPIIVVNPDGSINKANLTEILGGVEFNNDVVCIEQTVKLKDITMPRGSLDGAFIGDWCPGGETSGGITEGMVPHVDFDYNNATLNGNSTTSGNVTIRYLMPGVTGQAIIDAIQISHFNGLRTAERQVEYIKNCKNTREISLIFEHCIGKTSSINFDTAMDLALDIYIKCGFIIPSFDIEVILETEINEITNGRFSAKLDQWIDNVYYQNLSNAYWDANKSLVINYLEANGGTSLNPNSYITSQGVNVNKLAEDLSSINGQNIEQNLIDISKYLATHPTAIQTDLIYKNTIKECLLVETILLRRYKAGDILNIEAALDMFAAEKSRLRHETGISNTRTFSRIVESDYYQRYINEVINPKRYQEVLNEMLSNPDGKTGKVYCVQPLKDFNNYTLGQGTLGREEGYYVFSIGKR